MVENNKEYKDSWAMSLNNIVIKYFNENLPTFLLTNETSHGPYWGVTYIYEDLEIKIGGDIGFDIVIFIDKKKYNLWQYDRKVNNANDTTEVNILFQLDILKRFLDGL